MLIGSALTEQDLNALEDEVDLLEQAIENALNGDDLGHHIARLEEIISTIQLSKKFMCQEQRVVRLY